MKKPSILKVRKISDVIRGERAAALADENERGLGALLALEAPTSSQFVAQDGWGAVVPFLARRT